MGPDASTFELALTAIGTVIAGQWLAGRLYGPKKTKLSDLPFDRFGPLPESMIEKPSEEPKRFSAAEQVEINSRLREALPSLPDWITASPVPELPPPPPMLLLPRPLKLPLGEDGRESI